MSLISRLSKATSTDAINIMSKSEFAQIPYYVETPTILLNLAISAKWDGGSPAGKMTMFSGIPSSGKTRIAMLSGTKLLNDHKDSVVILIDSEYASGKESSIKDGMDTDRVIHIPLSRVLDENKDRNLEYQLIKIMDKIEKGDKVMIAAGVKGLDMKAGDWIKKVAPVVGGGGGGRADFAQAGGKDVSKIDEAKRVALEFAKENVKG